MLAWALAVAIMLATHGAERMGTSPGGGTPPAASSRALHGRDVGDRWLADLTRWEIMKGLQAIREFPGHNRTFTVAFLLAAAVRVVTMLAFRPAIWFGGDSASYVAVALRHKPDLSRISGYGLFLRLLHPFHSFMLVVAVQHLLGLLIGLAIYLLLRQRFLLPAWGATLAAVPVLFDAYQIQLEHEILSDVVFEALVAAAIIVALWWRGDRPAWADVTAGLLLAVSAIIRPIGLPLVALYLCYLLLRRARWRVFGAALVAAAIPLVMYLAWFSSTFQSVNFTRSSGIFLWSRTMSFANCSVIKPPADEAALCPTTTHRLGASSYIWVPQSPLNKMPGGRFSTKNNSLAQNFALRAITAQPVGYATAVLHDFTLSFYWNRPQHPSSYTADKYQFAAAERLWVSPNLRTPGGGTLRADQRAYSGSPSSATKAIEPYAGFMRGYQRFVYLRGTLLGIILLIGFAAIVRSWLDGGIRRLRDWGGPALLPWLTAVGLLLVPVATADFDLRYTIPSVPVACIAAALAFVRLGGQGTEGAPGSPRETGQKTTTQPQPQP
ncbi:MAG TPA: hypothetical protein VLW50_29985 [Streptosporangiaceae bacterium]|nr:hypothetical protein [Streptosporangiaceae bacterium]